MAFASSFFRSSKFLEHTHTLTKRLTVLACSDNTKDVAYVSLPFSHFTIMLDFFFLCQNIGWRYRRGCKKTIFFAGRSFLRPPLSSALGDRLYRL